jgi:hypothetical protein
MIQVESLSKHYGTTVAVDHLRALAVTNGIPDSRVDELLRG